ncbi:phytoene/squalene synthase family protein [Streptomyces marianii]|uniref:Phytoene/squalene synthetase n=1 Tax=Streptomyces marianii TaxID=1817406 RepID=A0A5R9EC13_9ACTN|nr:squalene/phytoene synthase family protein [Streptomyces marianii]TLQ46322.1 phytoene/squalene synthetase [Streptomyces marianii]
MPTWIRTLYQSGITNPQLRSDYTEQRRLVARYARAEYVAVRLLLPAQLVPDVIAATAFMHHSDNLIDHGPIEERLTALADWDGYVRKALASGTADQPVLRTLLHTFTRHPQLRAHIEGFLAGAPAEVAWEGFATEADFQDYINAYSHPAFMLIACLLSRPSEADTYSDRCRTFVEASQRLDFLADIAEDLGNGRLGIPQCALDQHGISRSDLHKGDNADVVGKLVKQQAALVRRGLKRSWELVDLVEPQGKQLIRALVTLQELRLRDVEKKGSALLSAPSGIPAGAALRVLAREYRAARSRRTGGSG